MLTRRELKEKAKQSLNGKYGDAIVVVLLLSIISSVVSFIFKKSFGIPTDVNQTYSITINLASFIVSALLNFGYTSFFLKLSRDEDIEVNELWSKMNMFIPYIIVSILISLFTTLWTLLLIIPGIIAALSYSMVYFIMLDNPEMSAMETIKESKKIMNGHKMDYFILQLSFLGWAILGAFTLGILYFWLIPYMEVTYCNFYNNIKELS